MPFSKYCSPPVIACLCAILVALSLAVFSNHVWEDYYITYRSSKNLATGHGLVFNQGERLHTFTSPLGVLLPALAYRLTGNTSDTGALWIFRMMSAAAFGGALLLLVKLAHREQRTWMPGALLAAWLITDAKSVDFTINGMETAFMLLFLAYTAWSHLSRGPRQWVHLGAAWAGLMWTRPDSFIYIGLIGIGFWLFNDPQHSGQSRRELAMLFLRAGLVTTALYLPWLLWATAYYGSPVPHTIVAKGGISKVTTLAGLITMAWQLPYRSWTEGSSLELTFLPSYYMLGGWPSLFVYFSKGLATLCSLLWVLPLLKPWPRTASFAFFGAHVYLSYFPYFPFPWYIPAATVLALVALSGLIHWMTTTPRFSSLLRVAAGLLTGALLISNGWILWQVARQTKAQQALVETGTRQKIGEWLQAQAMPGDTVFLEPLGYIGFFSNLKTYDWPGMSSQEMIKARQQVGANWGALLQYLDPTWIVLRPFEVDRVNQLSPGLLRDHYREAKKFTQAAAVTHLTVYGRPYLQHDAHFVVYHRRSEKVAPPPLLLVREQTPLSPLKAQTTAKPYIIEYNGHLVTVIGAPANFEFPTTPDLTELHGGFGLLNDEWFLVTQENPIEFQITLRESDGTLHELLKQTLHPVSLTADRGFLPFKITLPQLRGGVLQFTTRSVIKGTRSPVRAFWGELTVVPLHTDLTTKDDPIHLATGSKAQFGLANTEEAGQPCLLAHAPSELAYDWPPGLTHLAAEFGVMRAAYNAGNQTDGVIFAVEVVEAGGRTQTIFERYLDPFHQEADRGTQYLSVAIPALPGGRVLLRTKAAPSGRLNQAWSYWRKMTAKP